MIVSRADPVLVQRLFEMEVPEIYDGTVQDPCGPPVKPENAPRLPVQSRDKDVDPVGACVGMKRHARPVHHSRVAWRKNRHHSVFRGHGHVCAEGSFAGQGYARVQIIDPETRHLEIIVEDTQLSLAIGKKWARMCVWLQQADHRWNVDIKSEEEKRQEIEAADDRSCTRSRHAAFQNLKVWDRKRPTELNRTVSPPSKSWPT